MDIQKLQTDLQQRGFVVVEDLLPSDTLMQCREALLEYFCDDTSHFLFSNAGFAVPNAFEYVPAVRSLLCDIQLNEVVNRICGEDVVYLHHSDVHLNRLSSWHKDSEGDAGQSDPPIYKIAVYLQDHSSDTAGLTVRSGSHRQKDLGHGDVVNLHPRFGDVIVFNQQIDHVGQPANVADKVLRRICLGSQPFRSRMTARARRLRKSPDRLAVFWGVGAESDTSREFARSTIARQNQQNGVSHYQFEPRFAEKLAAAGRGVLSVT